MNRDLPNRSPTGDDDRSISLEALARAAVGAFYLLDPASGQARWLGGVAALCGDAPVEPDSARGWWRERVHPEDLPGVEASAAASASGTDYQLEYRLRHRDGHYLTVIDRGVSGHDAPGLPPRFLGCITDVTSRRRADAALRESEERLSLAVEAAGLGISHAIPFMPLEWAPRCCQILGLPFDTPPPDFDGFLALVHPADRDSLRADVERSLDPAGSGRYHAEFRALRPDGSTVWIQAHGHVHYAGAGANRRATRFIGVWQDVTERRLAEDRLATEKERLAVTLASIGDAVLATDQHGRVTLMNAVAERLTGWPAGEARGRPVDEILRLVQEDGGRPAELPVERVLRQGVVIGMANHTTLLARDGTARPIADSAAPIRDTHGSVSGVVMVFRDQTEERRLEAQLREAQKLESIGRLAGGVAHDFNNLLTVILGSAETLRQDLDAGARGDVQDLDQIRVAGERARDLTRQLLAFARRQVFQPQALDLNAALAASERLLRRVLGEDVLLVVEPLAGLWPIQTDPVQLEQVLLNLVVNARDAMPTGGTITIRTRNVDEGTEQPAGQWVELVVQDTGTGLTPEARAHLFEPFFTTKEPGHGTGLGLAMIHGIVTRSGGHIRAVSEPGRGTAFHVVLPRAASAPPAPVVSAVALRPVVRDSGTVLVIEDDELVRGFTCRTLRQAGFRVLEAAGGREALDLASGEAGHLDLAITDVAMPGMGGRAVAEALQLLQPDLPVLFVSGYAGDALSQRWALDTSRPFLPKPFTAASLLGRVRALLGGA